MAGSHGTAKIPISPMPATLMCHTNALRAAENSFPGWYSPDSANAIKSTVCPIGEWGYGRYLVGMDERGQVFGMDKLMVWKEFGDSGEDFLNEQSHDWRWPMRGRRG
jgi:hypothetical protein